MLTFQNTKVGHKILFKKVLPFWFLDMINNASKLEDEKEYTISDIYQTSSSTIIKLKETGDVQYNLAWFESDCTRQIDNGIRQIEREEREGKHLFSVDSKGRKVIK